MNQQQEVLIALFQGSKSTEEVQKCTGATYKVLSSLLSKGMVTKRLVKSGKTRVAYWHITMQGSYLAQKLEADNKKLSRFDRVRLYFKSLRI